MMTKRLVCAALVAGAFVSANATAADPAVDLGTVVFGLPTDFGGFAPVGDFTDLFAFVLPANGGSGYSVSNLFMDLQPVGLGTFNTVLASMTLFSNPDGVLTPNGDEAFIKTSSFPGGESLTMTLGPTAGGPLLLQITGLTNGTTGGIYTGGISVSPVPEPEVWAMMLVGAGLVGFQLRRKCKQSASNRFV